MRGQKVPLVACAEEVAAESGLDMQVAEREEDAVIGRGPLVGRLGRAAGGGVGSEDRRPLHRAVAAGQAAASSRAGGPIVAASQSTSAVTR